MVAGALLFAALHAGSGAPTVVASAVDGCALGALTLRRRTLTAAIAAHVTINTVACILDVTRLPR